MRWILLGVAVVIALAFLGTLAFQRRSGHPEALPVTAKALLSRSEQLLYGRLVRAFPGHIILAQVALSQLLVVARGERNGNRQSISNRFRQLVADFVVCAADFTALAVVELDDSSHGRKARRERDQRKDRFLREAGIKVIRIAVADMPNEAALKVLVAVVPTASPAVPLARRA
jgi:very-short-patch-repair endonuclease